MKIDVIEMFFCTFFKKIPSFCIVCFILFFLFLYPIYYFDFEHQKMRLNYRRF